MMPSATGVFLRLDMAEPEICPVVHARILADGGYAARVPVITPRRIARNRRQLQANRALRSLRMQIEHSIGFQKVYASINSIFRHKRSFLPFVVCTCGFLSNRRRL